MKHLPNLLTGFRCCGALALLFIAPWSPLFFFVYALCGLSDMADGWLARKWKAATPLGAFLDSMADLLLLCTVSAVVLSTLRLPTWALYWIGCIGVIRVTSLAIGSIRYQQLAFVHTYANKATGLILFCFPFLYVLWGLPICTAICCCAATLSALEELLLNSTAKTFDHNRTSLW